jgi:hypothetical protein
MTHRDAFKFGLACGFVLGTAVAQVVAMWVG